MLHQLFNFSHTKPFILACSGGVDSMAIADFYHRGNKNFRLAYFDHGTSQSKEMLDCVKQWSGKNNKQLFVGSINVDKPKEMSPEEFWRQERYAWLLSLGYDIVTCHHLNDCVEQYIFSSLHGNSKIILSKNVLSFRGNAAIVYRPFLTTCKQQLINWCVKNHIKWVEDKSNQDINYPRNFIRHQLLEQCLKVNPGLFKTVKKKIIDNQKIIMLSNNL